MSGERVDLAAAPMCEACELAGPTHGGACTRTHVQRVAALCELADEQETTSIDVVLVWNAMGVWDADS